MILEISGMGERRKVAVTSVAGERKVSVDGVEVPCDWVRLPDGQYSLILNGRVFDLSVEVDGDKCRVSGCAGRSELGIGDPKRLSSRKLVEDDRSGLQRICAEMPGKVIRVLVQPGDAVAYDQGLLVLEAMKMQNEIRAPKGGIVKEILVSDGKAVSTGDFLISLE